MYAGMCLSSSTTVLVIVTFVNKKAKITTKADINKNNFRDPTHTFGGNKFINCMAPIDICYHFPLEISENIKHD